MRFKPSAIVLLAPTINRAFPALGPECTFDLRHTSYGPYDEAVKKSQRVVAKETRKAFSRGAAKSAFYSPKRLPKGLSGKVDQREVTEHIVAQEVAAAADNEPENFDSDEFLHLVAAVYGLPDEDAGGVDVGWSDEVGKTILSMKELVPAEICTATLGEQTAMSPMCDLFRAFVAKFSKDEDLFDKAKDQSSPKG